MADRYVRIELNFDEATMILDALEILQPDDDVGRHRRDYLWDEVKMKVDAIEAARKDLEAARKGAAKR